MKQTPNNNFMTSDMLEFEDIYNKTNNAIFFLANLICPNSELANKLYFSIYNKIYMSIPLPKDDEKANELLDRIIIKQSVIIITSYSNAPIFDNKEDLANKFDEQMENYDKIPLEVVSKYAKPEFTSKIIDIFNQLLDSEKLCLTLLYYRDVPLERMAKYMGITLACVKHIICQANSDIELQMEKETGKRSYPTPSFLPTIFQRAEQLSHKTNPPPNLVETCTNALNFKEHRVEQESVAEFYKDEHTLDILKKKPVKLDKETIKKAGIVAAIIIGIIITIIIVLKILTAIFNWISNINAPENSPVQEMSYEEKSRERVLHDRYQDPVTGEYTEFSLRFLWDGDYEYSITKDGYKLTLLKGPDILEDYAFCDCEDLASISLPENIKSIGRYAFNDCQNLKVLDIPSSVLTIGNSAFENCYSLEYINLPDGLLTIEEGAFEYCRSLTQITIPKYVQSIEKDTFRECWSLTHFTLLSSFKTFDLDIFGDYTPIKRIDLPDTISSLESYDLSIINIDFYCRQGSKTEETLKACKAPNIYYITD